jgi:hypothetical protein
MNIELTASPNYIINGNIPFIAKTCILNPATEDEPESDIFTPTPPGVTRPDLPVIDTETQIIDTSPDQIIGCVDGLQEDNEQAIINSFFPDAIEGDGIVNKDNNDVWTYDGAIWNNVGPTPGRRVIVVTVLPPWNEIVQIVGRTRTLASVKSLPYELQKNSEALFTTKTNLTIKKPIFLTLPTPIQISMAPEVLDVSIGTAPVTSELTVKTGTAAPVLGNAQVTPTSIATDLGWTLQYDSTVDDQSILIGEFGFNFTLNNVVYTNCYVGSNSYLTFGAGAINYSSLGATVPSLPKLHIGAEDYSLQRIYTKTENKIFRVRWEGNTSTSALAGNSNRFLEVTFYEAIENGTQYLEVRSGNIPTPTSQPFMLATASTALATATFATNNSWVFIGNSTGTTWTVETGSYISLKLTLNIIANQSIVDIVANNPTIEAFNGRVIITDQVQIQIVTPLPEIERSTIEIYVPAIDNIIAKEVPQIIIGDPYFNSVSVLLHMDGSNGSTTFTDSSSSPLTVTANGNAQISTAQSKFGGASGYFDGSGDYLSIPDTSSGFSFGTGDFTYEFWFNSTATNAYSALITRAYSGAGGILISLNGPTGDGAPEIYWREYVNALFFKSSITGLNNGAWHHFAFVRSGTTCYMFIDGQQAASKTGVSTSVGSSTIYVGNDLEYGGRDFNGYIDDLRITRVARYNTTFTPPTAAFLNT